MVDLRLLVFLGIFAILGCNSANQVDVVAINQIKENVWLGTFQPGVTLAFETKDVILDPSCTFVTLHTVDGDFKCELAVEIKDVDNCMEIWKNHMMKWDSNLETHSGFSENTVYVTRLGDYEHPDAIIVDIRDGQPSIQAMPIDDWINNGYAIPKIPIPVGAAYGESLLKAMSYDDKGMWKDNPKPKFNERDLVVDQSEPATIYQVIDKNFAQDGKNIYGNAVDMENGWYYHCMVLIGENNGNRFRYIPESKLLKTKEGGENGAN